MLCFILILILFYFLFHFILFFLCFIFIFKFTAPGIPDPDHDPDSHHNLTDCSLDHARPLQKINRIFLIIPPIPTIRPRSL